VSLLVVLPSRTVGKESIESELDVNWIKSARINSAVAEREVRG
jgi:hypothetical protein